MTASTTTPQAAQTTAPSTGGDSRFHCIITVHGMGEPLRNSTLMPVAERISQVIHPRPGGDVLTLGMLSSLTGADGPGNAAFIPCIQLKGISVGRETPQGGSALPLPCATGENLYFADIFWSPITSTEFPETGDSLTHWTDCLLHRLDLKHQGLIGKEPESWWVLDLLTLLCQTLDFSAKALALRSKDLGDVIFGKYLGDVQLYGEFAQCRGTSVRLFHDSMAKIHAYLKDRHGDNIEYTVIAHSLGTVMALDSLMLAHAREDILKRPPVAGPDKGEAEAQKPKSAEPQVSSADLPFVGYAKAGSNPDVSWIGSVKSFVTMGSPIDKFLTLWWYNYAYMLDTGWLRARPDGTRIKHYNFCDEQDPVGHRLDFARTAPAFKEVFGPAAEETAWNDIVYNHTPLPGWAHVSYWKDRSLFDLIYRKAVEPIRPGNIDKQDIEKFQLYRRGTFFWILWIHFYLVPIACIGISVFTLTLALTAQGWHTVGLGFIGFLLSLWYGRQVLMLNLGWRQILKQKSRLSPKAPKSDRAESGGMAGGWAKAWHFLAHDKDFHSACARVSWRVFAALNWIAAFPVLALVWSGTRHPTGSLNPRTKILFFSAVVSIFLFVVCKRMFMKQDSPGTKPEVRGKSMTDFRIVELALVVAALLPCLLTPIARARGTVFHSLSRFRSVEHGLDALSIGTLLFLGILLQLSALYWTEVSWLHSWIKRRILSGSRGTGPVRAWQEDFDRYARETTV